MANSAQAQGAQNIVKTQEATPKASETVTKPSTPELTDANSYIDPDDGVRKPLPVYTMKDGTKKVAKINPQTGKPYVWEADQTPLADYVKSLITGDLKDKIFAQAFKHELKIRQGKLVRALNFQEQQKLNSEVAEIVDKAFSQFTF